MCLAVPGKIVEILDPDSQLAKVDVGGVRRNVNIVLLDDGESSLAIGDWVLIHVGFAMSRIDEEEAQRTLAALVAVGAVYEQELEDIHSSCIE